MFKKIVHIRYKNEISCGFTTVSYQKTEGEIKNLLIKHGCKRILSYYDEGDTGSNSITFELEDHAYNIIIPKVYVNKVYDEKIGIRNVFYVLRAVLGFMKTGHIDPNEFFLGQRLVIDAETQEMKRVSDYLVPKLEKDKVLLLPPVGGTRRDDNED